MGYYNPIFRMGDEKYIEGAAAASVDGMIVPDLPMEECGTLSRSCHASGIDLVQLVSPTTPFDRMIRIAKCSSGFLYVISALGTTGTRKELSGGIGPLVRSAKKASGDLPIAVGFGISERRHVISVLEAGADGAIVGSAILRKMIDNSSPSDIQDFVGSLKGKPCPERFP